MSRKLLPAGTVLKGYRIEKIIGEGGFGVTYLAFEPLLQTYVAIKEFFPKRYANRQSGSTIVPNGSIDDQRVFKWGLKRFLDEARALARLDHPNIIAVKKYFELHGTAYLVMDYCEGKALDKFVEDGVGVSPRKIFQIYVELTNSLEHVHQHGIIHADLKPSNILVRVDGTPVLLDFGSARQELLRIAVGQVSDGYSPPEFYANSEKVGPWSDIYGLAATFYKLITGVKIPIATERIVSDSYVSISSLIKDGYSIKFLELIDRSLKLQGSDRPQTISLLQRLLPDRRNFSDGNSLTKDLRGEKPPFEYPRTSGFNWKPAALAMGFLVIVWGFFSFVNQPAIKSQEVESFKVSPILIEEPTQSVESTPLKSKTYSSPSSNFTLQQELFELARLSTSTEITWYSIPTTDASRNSFKFVVREIKNQLRSAAYRKALDKNSEEYIFTGLSLANIRSWSYIASDTPCTGGQLGPVWGSCEKFDQEFKCRFNELEKRYAEFCISTLYLQ